MLKHTKETFFTLLRWNSKQRVSTLYSNSCWIILHTTKHVVIPKIIVLIIDDCVIKNYRFQTSVFVLFAVLSHNKIQLFLANCALTFNLFGSQFIRMGIVTRKQQSKDKYLLSVVWVVIKCKKNDVKLNLLFVDRHHVSRNIPKYTLQCHKWQKKWVKKCNNI